MSSPFSNKASVCEAIRVIISPMPIHKIIDQPSNLTINLLRQQVAKIATAMKTTSWGGRHRHLALMLNDTEYQTVMGIQPTELLVLSHLPAALANNTMITHCVRIMDDHNLECQEFWKQESIDAILVDKIVREAVDTMYVKELDDNFIGYGA